MAVHIFTVSEENYKVCVENGIVALPEAKEGKRHDSVVDGYPFYEETPICRIDCIHLDAGLNGHNIILKMN